MRLTIIALIAALLACIRVNQKLISRKLIIPTPSQPIKIIKILLADISNSIKKANKDKYIKKRTIYGSFSI